MLMQDAQPLISKEKRDFLHYYANEACMSVSKSKILLLKEDWDSAPTKGRFAGLDIGSKTIGVAICDSMQQIAYFSPQ